MVGHRRSSRDDAPAQYCPQCGTGLDGSENYCPDCGVSTDRSTDGAGARPDSESSTPARDRGRRQSDADAAARDRLEYRIAQASREGWTLEHDFGDYAVMVRRTFGSASEHVWVALLTVWFTMGFGNALWGAYRYFGDAERMVVRADSVERDAEQAGTTREPTTETDSASSRWRRTAGGYGVVAAIIALAALEIGPAAASLVLFALAALFATLGASVIPSVRRRLEARHPITANGRIRSVDERTVVAPASPCAACAEPVGRGIERIYREDVCVFGVPLTGDEGHNYYCRRCATGNETATTAVDDSTERDDERSAADRAELDANADLEAEMEPRSDRSAATESTSTRD